MSGSVERDRGPVGFHLELGAGRAYTLLQATDPAPHLLSCLPQAYITFKPVKFKGAQLDFGKFYTSAGAEVFESQDNWNYSRSLLYSWAVPGYHFGCASTFPWEAFYRWCAVSQWVEQRMGQQQRKDGRFDR